MSTAQITLVPSFILHLNGRRLEMEEEYSVQKVSVYERLNGIASATVSFSDPPLQLQEKEEFSIGSEITVTMGYKDNVKTLFKGEIVGNEITLKRDRPAVYSIRAVNSLHRLKHNISEIAYYGMTDSGIIEKIADRIGLSLVCEDFGITHPLYINSHRSDYNLLSYLTDFHGYDFYVRDTTLYVEKRSSKLGSDVILEWGKTLKDCHYQDNVSHQITRSTVSSTNPYTGEGFTSQIDNSSINGEGPASAEDFGNLGESMVGEVDLASLDEVEKRAETIFVQHARNYQNIRGTCEGNTDIVVGGVIELKEIGNRTSREYLVNDVFHILEPDKGFQTKFHLLSPVGAPDGRPAGMTRKEESRSVQDSDSSEETESVVNDSSEEAEEKSPQITNLQWRDGEGNNIGKAHVGDPVRLTADVKDIDDGESLKLQIFEKDSVNENDLIKQASLTVSGGTVEYAWDVEYHEDKDDANSAEEEEERGYTLPEYVFSLDHESSRTLSGDSGVLEAYVRFAYRIVGSDKRVLSDKAYCLVLADGSKRTGKTDAEGFIMEDELLIGINEIIL